MVLASNLILVVKYLPSQKDTRGSFESPELDEEEAPDRFNSSCACCNALLPSSTSLDNAQQTLNDSQISGSFGNKFSN